MKRALWIAGVLVTCFQISDEATGIDNLLHRGRQRGERQVLTRGDNLAVVEIEFQAVARFDQGNQRWTLNH